MQRIARPPARISVLAALSVGLVAAGCGSEGVQVAVGDTVEPATVDGDGATVSVSAGDGGAIVIDPVVDGVASLPDGWFEMSGYGVVLHVEGDEIVTHHVTASTCVVGDTADNELPVDHLDLDADDGVIVIDLAGPTTDYRLLPLAAPLVCDTDLVDDPAESVTALREVFDEHYPFFAERGIDWTASLDTIRSAVETDPQAFDAALADFMVELADGHTTVEALSIDPDLERFGMAEITTIDDAAAALQTELDASIARVDGLQTDPAGAVGWGMLDDSVGYLLLPAFQGIGDEADDPVADRNTLLDALDTAIEDLAEQAESVILDVRFNEGGWEDLAVAAAGYFVDDITPAYRKWAHDEPDPFVQVIDVEPQPVRFDGEVVVLTSPITASAAEVFTLAMAEVADATIIGNPSFGEFSDAFDWVLPNGLEFTLSMQVYTDLDGTNHEAVGVPVDVEAPFDHVLDTALAHLR